MLARDAANLFWAGRYLQRAEDTARLLDVTYHSLLETTPAEQEGVWADVLASVHLEGPFAELGVPAVAATVAEFLVLDPENPGSLVAAVDAARADLRGVREHVSTELWEAVNSFHLELRARRLRWELTHQPHELYGFVRRQCQAVAGVAAETLARDEGWRFFVLGWNLERAEMACRFLRIRHRRLDPADFPQWVATLRSASALEAYRRLYRASMDPVDVLELLLVSRTFPRSVLYSLREAERILEEQAGGDTAARPLRLLGRVRADLEYADVRELAAGDLERTLEATEEAIRAVCTAVGSRYFGDLEDHTLHSVHVLAGAPGRPGGTGGA